MAVAATHAIRQHVIQSDSIEDKTMNDEHGNWAMLMKDVDRGIRKHSDILEQIRGCTQHRAELERKRWLAEAQNHRQELLLLRQPHWAA